MDNKIEINLDAKRLIAITMLAIISIYTLYSYSLAIFAFINPDVNEPFVRVTGFDTYTTANVQSNSFGRGATVRVKGTVEMAASYYTIAPSYSSFTLNTPCIVSVAIYYDQSGITNLLGFYTTSVELTPGVPYNIQIDSRIPSNAVTGNNYYAKIFVWEDYMPESGESIIDNANSAETVKVFSAI